MKTTFSLIALLAAAPALAEESRQLGTHEHGVGLMNMAIDGDVLAIELNVPGADIVGFEHAATAEADRSAVERALAVLADPANLIALPAAAACRMDEAVAHLLGDTEAASDEHAAHDDHASHDHASDGHDDHEPDSHDHAAHDHDSHEHNDHGEAAHADHDEAHHAEHHDTAGGHTEFHAAYRWTCTNPTGLTSLAFPYFTAFENARELELQVITRSGAQAFEVMRDTPQVQLDGLF
ncbi:ZrgA family zinc uptake protein [Phaeobacter italicus]|uniref:ZrgA family zinc uptake protein n=1 Tax=Phaeobacter italicus TaxID=481446 RepID=UPI002FDB4D51